MHKTSSMLWRIMKLVLTLLHLTLLQSGLVTYPLRYADFFTLQPSSGRVTWELDYSSRAAVE